MLPRSLDLRWPRAVTALAVGLVGAASSAAVVGTLVAPVLRLTVEGILSPALLEWAVALPAGLTSVLAATWTIRAGAVSRGRGTLGAFGLAMVAAAGLALFVVGALLGELEPLLALVGALAGSIFAAPFGVLLGLLCRPVLRRLEQVRRNPSYVGRTRIVVEVAVWTIAVGLVAAFASVGVTAMVLAWTCVGLGLVAMGVAGIVHAHRVRWLARVAARRVDGWAIYPFEAVDVPIGIARWTAIPDPKGQRPGVLCRLAAGGPLAELRIPAALLS